MASSHKSRHSSAPITRTDTPPGELKVPAAPSSFKRTIDLPPDLDDYPCHDPMADLEADDDNIEMQQYLEHIYMTSKLAPDNSGAARDYGFSESLPIETRSDSRSAHNLKHKLKDGTSKGGSDRHRNHSHRFEAATSSSGSTTTRYATPPTIANWVQGTTGHRASASGRAVELRDNHGRSYGYSIPSPTLGQ